MKRGTVVPDKMFIHTTCVKEGFVTIFLGSDEDMKKGTKMEDVGQLIFCGVKMDGVLSNLKLQGSDVWKEGANSKCTLWNAKLYPCLPSPEESVQFALKMHGISTGRSQGHVEPLNWNGLTRYDMAGIIEDKNLQKIMARRRELNKKIMDALKK
eukprot:m.75253 g.75253  ORF g.75253 m.75253 type:complete len:154 (+) comp12491_c0_seq3:1372-1833(+)